ncbi:S1C family serine protease [Mycolicibacterium lacusdiani]|uniref:S1C family serine protease n=1 Tax=Mycolicibacterium lacusdiani TaxID=2895283 RepID=UPI001F1CACA4|nr:trypsin-like peptidase domain-containing protein [Mycolicibacterium lacusdiani]
MDDQSRLPSLSRLLVTGAVVVAVVSALMGGATALTVCPAGLPLCAAGGHIRGATVLGDSVQQIATRVLPSVVKLETTVGLLSFEGSGVIFRSDGLVMTNNHVVAVPEELTTGPHPVTRTATFSDGRTASFAMVGGDPASDVAVVRVEDAEHLLPIALGSSADLHVGQEVMAVGSPLGMDGTVTSGIISALHRPVSAAGDITQDDAVLDAIQTDAAINPGSSGGALVDSTGALVGLIAAFATATVDYVNGPGGSIGLGFAIPVDQAARIAGQLAVSGVAVHATLGVELVSASPVRGAKVVAVAPGGPADAAGIPEDALITKIDDRGIANANAVTAYLHSKVPGDSLTLTFVDPRGVVETTRVILGVQ